MLCDISDARFTNRRFPLRFLSSYFLAEIAIWLAGQGSIRIFITLDERQSTLRIAQNPDLDDGSENREAVPADVCVCLRHV